MALENPNFVSDLDQAAPSFQDQRSEGDDHLRAIKKAIVATFPGFNGRIYRRRNVSATGALASTDNGAIINATGTLTLTPTAAASLGNGWMCWVRAATGTVTIDPTSSEKVNGALTQNLPVGYTGILFCDGTEFFMLVAYKDVPTVTPPVPASTRMVFQQTSVPTGWTKVSNVQYEDAVPRFTTGTVGTGGVDAFTSVFGVSKSTGALALSIAQMPSHTHPFDVVNGIQQANASSNTDTARSGGNTTGATGGGGSHSHTLTMNPKYVDLIVGVKD